MLGQFLATFAGVLLSFLLWFGGEWLIKNWREKGAREHLSREIVKEIEDNIMVLNVFVNSIEEQLQKGMILSLGVKLDISARHYAISSGELRLIRSSKHRELIRYSLYACENFNHIVETTELILAVVNLKEHYQSLSEATYRLNQFKESAKAKAIYLQSIIEGLSSLRLDRKSNQGKGP